MGLPSQEIATFAFDTQATGKGKPAAVTRAGVTEHTWTYDAQGRPSVETRTVDGVAYPFTTTYMPNSSQLASVQFPRSPHYPAGLTLSYTYTTSGYLKSVQSVAANGNPATTYWQASAQDAEGHLAAFALGNGVNTNRGYHPYTGLLTTLNSSSNNFTTNDIQQEAYTFDALGNLVTREDDRQTVVQGSTNVPLSETFGYDGDNRVTSSQVVGQAAKPYTYDALGNFVTKAGLTGSFTYGGTTGGPHAVTAVKTIGETHKNVPRNQTEIGGNPRQDLWLESGAFRRVHE